MINIFCVKIGTKYDSSYANRLFEMCRKNITRPFKFFCYTDDPQGLLYEITPIPMVDNSINVIVFNKLYLLSSEFTQLVNNDNPCLFFDLDIVIKSNIDRLVDLATASDGKIKVINAVWKNYDRKHVGPPTYEHHINSSCIIWKPHVNNHIWQRFSDNKQRFQTIFARGMDCFLFYEFKVCGGLPEDMFYSYLYGIDRKIFRMAASVSDYHKTRMNIPVVIFNGPTFQEDIEEFINSGYEKEFSCFEEFITSSSEKRELLRDAVFAELDRRILLSAF